MELDARAGKMLPVLTARNSESFKGCNDLHIASSGDIYFTDQGQTGLHDPTGRVYRLRPSGQLDCLIDTGISPNGLVLDPSERVLFVAMTRDNAVWRAPFMKDGGVSKVGRFCSMFGPSGPDGMTMDGKGRLFVLSLGHVFVFAPNGEMIARIKSCAGPAAPMSRSAERSGTGFTLRVGDGRCWWLTSVCWIRNHLLHGGRARPQASTSVLRIPQSLPPRSGSHPGFE